MRIALIYILWWLYTTHDICLDLFNSAYESASSNQYLMELKLINLFSTDFMPNYSRLVSHALLSHTHFIYLIMKRLSTRFSPGFHRPTTVHNGYNNKSELK